MGRKKLSEDEKLNKVAIRLGTVHEARLAEIISIHSFKNNSEAIRATIDHFYRQRTKIKTKGDINGATKRTNESN